MYIYEGNGPAASVASQMRRCNTSDGLDDLVSSDQAAASLQGRYYSRLSQLRGACFYAGACNQHTEHRIKETADYIADAEILSAG